MFSMAFYERVSNAVYNSVTEIPVKNFVTTLRWGELNGWMKND